jgi:hypothetical protein
VTVVCPACHAATSVVEDYEPGSILACSGCGARVEFLGPDAVRLVPNGRPLFRASQPPPPPRGSSPDED